MDTSKNDIAKLYNFAELRQSGSIYVDKTSYLHQLVTWNGIKSFIVTRPRRFGKSLMISTLQHILEGHKELFKGLYIAEKTDYDWKPVKVLHLDMSDIEVKGIEAFKKDFEGYVSGVLKDAGYEDYNPQYSPARNFGDALKALTSKGHPIAVLIDEYDAPIGNALNNLTLAEAVRTELYGFYKKLKIHEKQICFLMLTGVARFAQLSVFSGLNNLTDLNNDDRFATMFGYTDAELVAYFGEHMKAQAEFMNLEYADYRKEIKRWFNGYCFNIGCETVYNPFSIASVLTTRRKSGLLHAWTQGCRPTMLVTYLNKHPTALYEPFFSDTVAASETLLGNTSDLSALPPVAMLYQTGYLTICGEEPITGDYLLRIPDEEIRRDLYGLYVDMAANQRDSAWREGTVRQLIYDNPSGFVKKMSSLYAKMHYGSSEDDEKIYEGNYQRVLQAILIASNVPCNAEATQSNRNRSDVIVELPTIVYIFELKAGKTDTADTALQQIHDKGYAKPYLGTGRKIYLIGLAFDPDTHELKDSKIETLPQS